MTLLSPQDAVTPLGGAGTSQKGLLTLQSRELQTVPSRLLPCVIPVHRKKRNSIGGCPQDVSDLSKCLIRKPTWLSSTGEPSLYVEESILPSHLGDVGREDSILSRSQQVLKIWADMLAVIQSSGSEREQEMEQGDFIVGDGPSLGCLGGLPAWR